MNRIILLSAVLALGFSAPAFAGKDGSTNSTGPSRSDFSGDATKDGSIGSSARVPAQFEVNPNAAPDVALQPANSRNTGGRVPAQFEANPFAGR